MNAEKHIKITGYSNVSWKDAIVKTVEEAAQTLNNLSSIVILEQKARISNNKIVEYLVDLDISFFIEPEVKPVNTEDNDNM